MAKTEVISAADYQNMKVGKGSARARTTPKRDKEADSSDISETPEQQAMNCVSVKGCQYVEYADTYLVFTAPDGKKYRLTIKPEKG
jgi:hypothetical protein